MLAELTAPQRLVEQHRLDDFVCAETSLETWLKQRARGNEASNANRCYVVCHDLHVVGYYTLSSAAIIHADTPGSLKRNMPNPVPAILLGRLAVHSGWAGKGIGKDLLSNAIRRALVLSNEVGVAVLLCHALNEQVKPFYTDRGFVESPGSPLTLMLSLKKARAFL